MNTDEFSSKYVFNKGKRNFVLNETEVERRSFLSNLEELGIKNAPEKTKEMNYENNKKIHTKRKRNTKTEGEAEAEEAC